MGKPGFLPLAEPAGHRGDVRVAELGERPRGEGAARAAGAVEDDLLRLVRDLLLDALLEEAARDEDRAGHVALAPTRRPRARRRGRRPSPRAGAGLLDRDLADLGLDLADQLLERAHRSSSRAGGGAPGRRQSFADAPVRRDDTSIITRAVLAVLQSAPRPSWRRSSRADLSRFEVPDLLTFLNLGRRTGVLPSSGPTRRSKLFFREGRPVFATSTADDLRFGSHARAVREARARTLSTRVLARDPAHGRASARPCSGEAPERGGARLVPQGAGLRGHLRHLRLARRASSRSSTRSPPPATAVTLDMDLQNLSWRGCAASTSASRLAEVFPDLNMVVEAMANPERVKQSVTLTPGRMAGLLPRRRPAQPERDLPPGRQPRRAGHPADPPPPGGGQVRAPA